jgi:trimethylamine---corrinoid protein Co-methyltransferase
MMSGLAAALAGADSLIAAGCLDGAQNQSLAKMVLDCETIGMIRRFARTAAVDETEALIDDMVAVGIGGHFLASKATRRRMRSAELWRPAVYQRGPFEEYHERSLVEDAVARARELLVTHEVPPLDDDAEKEIARIIAGVRRSV